MASDTNDRIYKLLSVNTAPDRAARMIAKLAAEVRPRYNIVHCGNAQEIADVRDLVTRHRPNIMFCASMWSQEQSAEIIRIGREVVPDLRCYVVPQGMQIQYGPEYTVQHVISKLPEVVEADLGLL